LRYLSESCWGQQGKRSDRIPGETPQNCETAA
jgi:hypothetical protein